MKKILTIISLLILTQCLGGCGTFVDFSLSARQFGDECLSTSEYTSEIKSAMKKAENKYHDKTIELAGKVYAVGTYGNSTEAFVKMYDAGEGRLIKEVAVTMENFNDAQKVKKNDLIKIRGKFDSAQNKKEVFDGKIYDRYQIFLIGGELVK